jgi:hypothetical protein
VFASDETVEPDRPNLLPSSEFYRLWGGDAAPQFPGDGSMPDWHTYFPPVGGFRFGMLTIPPATGADEQDFSSVEDAVASRSLVLSIRSNTNLSPIADTTPWALSHAVVTAAIRARRPDHSNVRPPSAPMLRVQRPS